METNRVGHEGRRDWVLDGGRRCAQGPNGLEGGGKRGRERSKKKTRSKNEAFLAVSDAQTILFLAFGRRDVGRETSRTGGSSTRSPQVR